MTSIGAGLGEAVRLRREQRGMGQEQLAAALGVRQQTVSRWENGLAVPRPGRVVELARVLGLEPSALHRLAGYLPAAASRTSAWAQVEACLTELSHAELVLLVERAWDELRAREAADREDADAEDPGAQDEAAAG